MAVDGARGKIMTKFVDLHSTAAVLDPGFTFSAYSAEMNVAANSIDDAATTMMAMDPSSMTPLGVGTMHMGWPDGTHLQFGISSIRCPDAGAARLEVVTIGSVGY